MEQKKTKFRILKKDDIIKTKKTYKDYDSFLNHRLMSSILLYGQITPIIVEKNGEVFNLISGSRIFDTMIQIGYEEFICVEIDDTHKIADIVLNELQYKTNYIELSERLLDTNIDEIKNLLPFTEEEIVKIKTIMSYDWSTLIKKKDECQVSIFDDIDNIEDTQSTESESIINEL